jgi:hypothetical protein
MSNSEISKQSEDMPLYQRVAQILRESGEQMLVERLTQGSADALITVASVAYPDGTPVRVTISEGGQPPGRVMLWDEGRTISYVRATAQRLKKPEALDLYIRRIKQPPIQRSGVILTTTSLLDSASLPGAVNLFATACHSLGIIGDATAEMEEWEKNKKREEREERERRSFRLKTREEVVAFQKHLVAYAAHRARFRFNQMSLVDVYDSLAKRTDRERILAAVLDILIGYTALLMDSLEAERTWKRFFGRGRIESGSIFDSPIAFAARMDIHRSNTSFVLRYRALWDKIMGLYILLMLPGQYESFAEARSRKAAFKKLIEGHLTQFTDLAGSIVNLVTEFDDQFRTSEAHGAGVLRKWTLIIEPLDESPQMELGLYRARMTTVLTRIGDIFRGPEKTMLRELSETWARLEGKPMPQDLRHLMKSLLALFTSLVPRFVASHHNAMIRVQIHLSGLLTGIHASWVHRSPDRKLEKKDVQEIEKAVAELPEPQPPLLELINRIINYPTGPV